MISVIIPMYNSEDTIKRALDSIKNQTALDKIEEIIIVNDGSKDRSLETVEEYHLNNKELPIKVIDKKNGGVSTARNTGLRAAKSKYVALLDSDDEWAPTKTEKQLEILENNPEIDFIGCNRNNEDIKILFKKVDKLHKASLKELIITMFPQTSTAIFKRSVIDKVGYYDENQKYAEDGNYWMKICANCNFYVIPDSLVITGGGKPSFGHSGLSGNLKEMQLGTIKNIKDLLNEGYINKFQYTITYAFYYIKYVRRIIITKMR